MTEVESRKVGGIVKKQLGEWIAFLKRDGNLSWRELEDMFHLQQPIGRRRQAGKTAQRIADKAGARVRGVHKIKPVSD